MRRRRHQRIPEIVTVVLLHVVLWRRWISEVVIVALMLVVLLVELALGGWLGAHPGANVVVGALLFGLFATWVYVNRVALAAWAQQNTQERDHPGAGSGTGGERGSARDHAAGTQTPE